VELLIQHAAAAGWDENEAADKLGWVLEEVGD
jgi:hypothetical protein